jgi:hypothetical protein
VALKKKTTKTDPQQRGKCLYAAVVKAECLFRKVTVTRGEMASSFEFFSLAPSVETERNTKSLKGWQ